MSMRLCCSSQSSPEEQMARQKSMEIDREFELHSLRLKNRIRVLLLGSSESGKSTVFKQVRSLYGGYVYTPRELEFFRSLIRQNILQIVHEAGTGLCNLKIAPCNPENEPFLSREGMEQFKEMYRNRSYASVIEDPESFAHISKYVRALSSDPCLSTIVKNMNGMNLLDSVTYWFPNEIERVLDENYVPNEKDILQSRALTTSVQEIEVPLKRANAVIPDAAASTSSPVNHVSAAQVQQLQVSQTGSSSAAASVKASHSPRGSLTADNNTGSVATPTAIAAEPSSSNPRGIMLNLVDVGGVRSQRKTWFSLFVDVHAVLFVTAISSFCQFMREIPTMNRLVDSLALFDSVVNNKYLIEIPFILFLNKVDLFKYFLKSHSLSMAFPEYDGDNSLSHASNYIFTKFNKMNKNPRRPIYTYSTFATDVKQLSKIFLSVEKIIIQLSLRSSGLIR